MSQETKEVFVVHHTDLDGISAAMIVKEYCKKYDELHLVFIAVNYDADLRENKLLQEYEFDDGYIVDYSFTEATRDQLFWLNRRCKGQLHWFDHHPTNDVLIREAVCNGIHVVNDQSRCGALITWNELFSHDAIPQALFFIDDHDRWVHSDSRSKIFNLACVSVGLNIDNAKIHHSLFADHNNETSVSDLLDLGYLLEAGQREKNRSLCKRALFKATFEGIPCFALNCFGSSQSFGEYIDQRPLCVTFMFNGKEYVYGLYSKDGQTNCTELAQKFGGNGHLGASGFMSAEFLLHDCERI